MNRTELLKIAKPINMKTWEVQAILDNRKSATRGVIKPKYSDSIFEMDQGILYETEPYTPPVDLGNGLTEFKVRQFVECKPPYEVGDYLYIRESGLIQSMKNFEKKIKILFKVDNSLVEFDVSDKEYERLLKWESLKKWLSPYWLTKETARIFLKITDVRVERLQEITEEQAIKEGIQHFDTKLDETFGLTRKEVWFENLIYCYKWLRDSTIKKQDLYRYGWNANPWVEVTEFERVEV